MLPIGNIVQYAQNGFNIAVCRPATLRLFAWNHWSCLNLASRQHCAVCVKSLILLESRRPATMRCLRKITDPAWISPAGNTVLPAFHVIVCLYSYWAFPIFLILLFVTIINIIATAVMLSRSRNLWSGTIRHTGAALFPPSAALLSGV